MKMLTALAAAASMLALAGAATAQPRAYDTVTREDAGHHMRMERHHMMRHHHMMMRRHHRMMHHHMMHPDNH